MNPERWEQVKDLFLEALDVAEDRREAFLEEQSAGDEELLAEARRMLRGHLAADDFIEPPAIQRLLGKEESLEPDAIESGSLKDFQILREIGQGGMGRVYLARQKSLNRLVAIKVLLPKAAGGDSAEQFREEPAKLARLQHPNIVPVHWYAEEKGVSYFVMEYVHGKHLGAVIDQVRAVRSGAKSVPSDEVGPRALLGEGAGAYFEGVAELVAKTADALQHAHEQGLVHRDVKPGNILVDEEGEPHLVDFGIAKEIDRATLTSRVLGTPHYMSPEQARVKEVRVDHRTDVYSLGVVLYELLTLRRPYDGDTYAQLLWAIREVDPPTAASCDQRIPRDLELICHKAIRKEPSERYASAAEFAEDLRRFLAHEAPLAEAPSPISRARRFVRRRRKPLAAASLLLLGLLAGGLGASSWAAREHRESIVADALQAALPPAPERSTIAELDEQMGQLRTCVDALAAARAFGDALSDGEREALDGRAGELATFARGAASSALRVADGVGSIPPADRREADRDALRSAQHVLWTLLDLFPEESELLAGGPGELYSPRVSLTTDPPGARVELRALDWRTGLPLPGSERVYVGRAPLDAVRVPPGTHRLVATSDDGRTGELFVHALEAGLPIRLPTLRLRDPSEVSEGMVRIEGGRYELPDGAQREAAMGRGLVDSFGEVRLGGFLVDRTEVPCGDYRAFLLATGRDAPRLWPDDWRTAWLPEWDVLPAVGVSHRDASAFAAWSGKRLLTGIEYQYLVSGDVARPYPWGDVESDPADRANVRPEGDGAAPLEHVETDEERWDEFVRHVVPVDSMPAGATPEGVRHLVGNVWEWIDEILPGVEDTPGTRQPDSQARAAVGGSYAQALRPPLDRLRVVADAQFQALGFRCAKSLDP